MIDLHCHVLPGLDDGPDTMDEALELLAAQAAAGVTIVAATSHVSATYPDNTAARIAAAVDEVNAAAADAGIAVQVIPGAEVALLRAGELDDDELVRLRLGGGPWLLLEPPHVAAPAAVEGAVGELLDRGHRLLLAHPERSSAFLQEPDALRRLVLDRGVRCSVTATAVSGAFGRTVRRFALELLREGLVHDLASDAHAGRVGRPAGLREHLGGTGFEPLAEWLCETAPAAILSGAEIPPAPAASPPRPHGLGRLRRWAARD